MTSNKKSKTKSKKAATKKSSTKKRTTKKSQKKTGSKKAASKKSASKVAGSKKTSTASNSPNEAGSSQITTRQRGGGMATATKNASMAPVELFDPYEGAAMETNSFPGTAVAEPWQERQSGLPDLMARNITESLDARSKTTAEAEALALDAFAADLDTDAVTAGSPTWRAFKASAKEPSGFFGRSLIGVWNVLMWLLGAPPPANNK